MSHHNVITAGEDCFSVADNASYKNIRKKVELFERNIFIACTFGDYEFNRFNLSVDELVKCLNL